MSRLHGVKQSGSGLTAQCPAHEDLHNSLSVSEGDDGRILLKCHANCDTRDVVNALRLSMSDLFPKPSKRQKRRVAAHYPYTDDKGKLVFEVIRYEPKGFAQRRPDLGNPNEWIWNTKGIKKPLYNLPEVQEGIKSGKTIFVVEGEKDVESLKRIGIVATTNAGGAGKWNKAYNKILAHAKAVVIIPDDDETGRQHAELVRSQLSNAAILDLPNLPKKGDVTDWINQGGKPDELPRLAQEAIKNPPKPAKSQKPLTKHHFTPLGYDRDLYFFLSHMTGQIVTLTPTSLGRRTNLFQIAPLQYWEQNYLGGTSANFTAAADDLMSMCRNAGIFDSERIRGRGAWIDRGRVCLHQGDHLVIDSQTTGLFEADTKYVYERALRLAIPHTSPLSTMQTRKLIEMCTLLPWECPASATLLAGWLANAPICGALKWRSHIWLTGPAGSGKSWAIDNIIKPLLGKIALHVQSSTTEAGLRQSLGQDARPVLFDEAENEGRAAQSRLQKVLELARQASSESGASIVKGTATGETKRYNIRSCFLMSSIAVGVRRRADETRVTILSFRSPRHHSQSDFKILQDLVFRYITPDFCQGMVARSCKLASVIRKNAETFAIAAAETLGGRRQSDQIGALLAGFWSLEHDGYVEADKALDFTRELCLEDYLPDEAECDENRCLNHILEQKVRLEVNDKSVERTIGEVVEGASGMNEELLPILAQKVLKRHGIRADEEGLLVSNKHSAIAKMLSDTPWETNWNVFLKRIKGAKSPENPITFPGHIVSRVVCIPWNSIGQERSEQKQEQEESLF